MNDLPAVREYESFASDSMNTYRRGDDVKILADAAIAALTKQVEHYLYLVNDCAKSQQWHEAELRKAEARCQELATELASDQPQPLWWEWRQCAGAAEARVKELEASVTYEHERLEAVDSLRRLAEAENAALRAEVTELKRALAGNGVVMERNRVLEDENEKLAWLWMLFEEAEPALADALAARYAERET